MGLDGLPGTADDVQVATTLTTATGEYLFVNQDPGEYFVQFDLTTLPADHVVTFADQGTDDARDSDADAVTGETPTTGFLDGSGVDTNDVTLDLGIYVPVTVGDLVWEDRNGDGVQDADEPGVGGVTVRLFEVGPDGEVGTSDDVEVGTDETDSKGNYLFTGLPPRNYYIEIDANTLPDGAVLAPIGQGCADGAPGEICDEDSDVDPDTGRSGPIELLFGDDDRTWDVGFFVPFDLRLTKAAVNDLVIGSDATFLLTVTNVGPGVAFGPLEVVDELPAGLVYDSFTGTGWSCTAAGQTVTCRYDGDMTADASSELRIVVGVTSDATSGLVNEASVVAIETGVLDSTPGNGTSATPALSVTSRSSALPSTGNNTIDLVLLAAALLALGALLRTFAARRRVAATDRGDST